MAARVSGGYDYKLVDEKKSSKYTCPVCTLVLRDPQLTRCGHLICESCLQQLNNKGRNFTCPVGNCRASLTSVSCFPDQRVNLKIKSLQVYCNSKDDGCQWKGDLKDIEDHLKKCPYQLVSCSNDCGMDSLQRRHLQSHLKNDCPKRFVKCQYCNKRGHHQYITGNHLGVCPWYPIRCTNGGCDQQIPRLQMPLHNASCPKEMISCGYRSVGCEEKMKREEQEEHNEQWRERHLQFAVGEVKKLNSAITGLQKDYQLSVGEVNKLNSTIAGLQKEHQLAVGDIGGVKAMAASNQRLHINSVIKFSGFADKRRTNTPWYSPGFYTSPGGYKMCLRVFANGAGDGEGTHVSCYVCLMSGEYDDILEWPFRGEVTIELLNQLKDGCHFKEVVQYNKSTAQEYNSRVIGGEYVKKGLGNRKFFSHSQLDVNPASHNCQYLRDDTLYFRVSVEVTSNTKQWLVV